MQPNTSQIVEPPVSLPRRVLRRATAGYAWWGMLVTALSIVFLLAAQAARATAL